MKEIFFQNQETFIGKRNLELAFATVFYTKEIHAQRSSFGINGPLNNIEEETIARWVSNYHFGIKSVVSLFPEDGHETQIKFKWIKDPLQLTQKKSLKSPNKQNILYYSTNLEYSGLAVKRLFIHNFLPEYSEQIEHLFKDVVKHRHKIRQAGEEIIKEAPQAITTSKLGLSASDMSFIINIDWITSLVKLWGTKAKLKPYQLGGITSTNYSDLFLIAGIEEGAHYVYKKSRN